MTHHTLHAALTYSYDPLIYKANRSNRKCGAAENSGLNGNNCDYNANLNPNPNSNPNIRGHLFDRVFSSQRFLSL